MSRHICGSTVHEPALPSMPAVPKYAVKQREDAIRRLRKQKAEYDKKYGGSGLRKQEEMFREISRSWGVAIQLPVIQQKNQQGDPCWFSVWM